MDIYHNHTFPGQAFPKWLTSTQCSSLHKFLTTSERMCLTLHLNLQNSRTLGWKGYGMLFIILNYNNADKNDLSAIIYFSVIR